MARDRSTCSTCSMAPPAPASVPGNSMALPIYLLCPCMPHHKKPSIGTYQSQTPTHHHPARPSCHKPASSFLHFKIFLGIRVLLFSSFNFLLMVPSPHTVASAFFSWQRKHHHNFTSVDVIAPLQYTPLFACSYTVS